MQLLASQVTTVKFIHIALQIDCMQCFQSRRDFESLLASACIHLTTTGLREDGLFGRKGEEVNAMKLL
jgi:hypothetical protein